MVNLPSIKTKPIKFGIIIAAVLLGLGIICYEHEKKEETYPLSIEFIKNNNDLLIYLGEIKKYEFQKAGKSGWKFEKHYYHIYLDGVKEKGMLYIFFNREIGEWRISKAELLLKDRGLIHLSPKLGR